MTNRDTDESPTQRWGKRLAVLGGVIAAAVALRLTVLAPEPVEVRVVAVGPRAGRVNAHELEGRHRACPTSLPTHGRNWRTCRRDRTSRGRACCCRRASGTAERHEPPRSAGAGATGCRGGRLATERRHVCVAIGRAASLRAPRSSPNATSHRKMFSTSCSTPMTPPV